ncbi:MAG: cytochrome c-type biogenesis protein CcmH [Acidimicrobiales bacterium]
MTARLKLSYGVLAVVVAVGLLLATRTTVRTDPIDRAHAVAETIKCPTCRGQSVAQSDAPASAAIRTEISRRIDAGESNDAIRDYFAAQYGEDILLRPAASGFAGLVWVVPVAVVAAGVIVLAFAFRRWRRWGLPA